jgi:hypothetical protein
MRLILKGIVKNTFKSQDGETFWVVDVPDSVVKGKSDIVNLRSSKKYEFGQVLEVPVEVNAKWATEII